MLQTAGMRGTRLSAGAVVVFAGVALAWLAPTATAAPHALPTHTIRLPDAAGRAAPQPGSASTVEPRISAGPDGRLWAITNEPAGPAVVYGAHHGATWRATPALITDQREPTVDTDITTTRSGRVVAVELDGVALSFRVSYSDDGGRTWHASAGVFPTDGDRPWLASGPHHHVYLLFHNLFSGALHHDMWVQTSTDDGRSFGPPVPVAIPGERAWADLQCADASGPAGIAVDQRTGRLVVSWATRTSIAGGCGADLPPGQIEASVVFATRIWVATSTTGAAGSWHLTVAVDESRSRRIVDTQFAAPAIDSTGRVYVVYEQTRSADDLTGGVRLVSAPPTLAHWSAPLVLDRPHDAGDVLATLVAGRAGRLAVFWLHGVGAAHRAIWRPAGVFVHGAATVPLALPATAAYRGSAADVDGVCDSTPGGDTDWLLCSRAADDFGGTLTPDGRAAFIWAGGMPGRTDGTYVTTTGPILR